jgi:hypothetical protein
MPFDSGALERLVGATGEGVGGVWTGIGDVDLPCGGSDRPARRFRGLYGLVCDGLQLEPQSARLSQLAQPDLNHLAFGRVEKLVDSNLSSVRSRFCGRTGRLDGLRRFDLSIAKADGCAL